MVDFLVGSIYTLGVLVFGIFLGYFYGSKENKLEERRKRVQAIKLKIRNRGEKSGSIKPKMTTLDAEREDRKPFEDRLKYLGGNPRDNDNDFFQP